MSRFPPRSIVLVSVLLLSLAFPSLGTAVTADSSPSVILISIDTLRADHLSAYGYTHLSTPHLDSFARGGTRFVHAEAQVPLTLPSHTSLFTSTYPFVNQVEENGERVPRDAVTLASVLRARGYQTAAFIGSDFLDRHYGLDIGFDEYDSPFGHAPGATANLQPASMRRDGALVLRAARQWLEAHRGQPVCVFVHLFDLHIPYTLPASVAARQGISRYDAQLAYVDRLMGGFQQILVRDGWWSKSIVVLFGDHGEGLGDHGEADHGYYVYESTLHVPLLVHWPASPLAFVPVAMAPVGLIDVAPTILSYLNVPIPGSFEGASLLGPLKEGQSKSSSVYSESLYAHDAFGWAPLRVLRAGKYKYIDAPKAELYNLDSDPGERLNLLGTNRALAAELAGELANVQARFASARKETQAALPPETLAELESLGYLSAAPRTGDRAALGSASIQKALPDPKDRFPEFAAYQSAYVDFLSGRNAIALAKFQSGLRGDTQNTLARFHLGECYLRLKKPQDALREWTTTLKLDPQYAPAAEAMGQYWLEHNDYQQARRRFEQVLALTPDSYSGHIGLAVADEHLGLFAEARQHYAAACQISPHDEACTRKPQYTESHVGVR